MAKDDFTKKSNSFDGLENLLAQQDQQTDNVVPADNDTPPVSEPSPQPNPKKNKKGKKNPKKRSSHLDAEIIAAYQAMPIFSKISRKQLKEYDIAKLHQLAKQLKKSHPDMAIENILKNQVELYITILKERQKYYRANSTDDARDAMNKAIADKLNNLVKKPLINQLYNYGEEDWSKILLATKKDSSSDYEINSAEDFLDSAEKLESLFENEKKRKEDRKKQKEERKEKPLTITELSSEELDARSKQEDKKEEKPQVTNSEDNDSISATPAAQAQSPANPAAQAQSSQPAAQAQSPASAASSQQTAQPANPASPNSAPISSEDTSTTEEDDDDYKAYWRKYANSVADKLGGKMEEDTSASTFEAKVTTDNDTTYISATSKSNVSLGAQKKDGTSTVPDQKVFDELALKSKDNGINFGDIKTPEFKARLMIACLKHGVEMSGQPKLDDEFLNLLDANGESAKYLKAYKNKQNTQQQPTSQQPAPTSQNNYEKTRDERKKMLELHSKTRVLTPQEQHELKHIQDVKAWKQAHDEAVTRTGDDDPRTAEHTQTSRLYAENYSYHSPTQRSWKGWKFHLDVVPNRNDPTTKAVSEFLETLGVDHKIAKGGENGKGMTIYVGGYDDAYKLAQEIKSRFGEDIATPPPYTDQKSEEIDFNNKVTGRFYIQNTYAVQYPRCSIKGICPAEYGSTADENMCSLLADLAIREQIVDKDFALELIPHSNNFHDHYVFRNLESYCSHKLYQKHLGEYYCGKNADKFEEQVFGDALPPKGSPERATWDKIADLYIQKSEKDYLPGIQTMQDLKKNYTPIDFNKVPPLVRPQQQQRQP